MIEKKICKRILPEFFFWKVAVPPIYEQDSFSSHLLWNFCLHSGISFRYIIMYVSSKSYERFSTPDQVPLSILLLVIFWRLIKNVKFISSPIPNELIWSHNFMLFWFHKFDPINSSPFVVCEDVSTARTVLELSKLYWLA